MKILGSAKKRYRIVSFFNARALSNKSFSRDERGVVLILFALLLPALLITAALVINYTGVESTEYRGPFRDLTEMQAVADAAARAGASMAVTNGSNNAIKAEARAVAAVNNYPANNATVDVHIGDEITFGAYEGSNNAVEVVITSRNYKFPFLADLLNVGDGVTLRARAVAIWMAPCIIALNTNTQNSAQVGIDFSGAQTSVRAPCALYSNYPGDKSIRTGSATVCADQLFMVGSLDGNISGCEGDPPRPPAIFPGATAYPNPFTKLDPFFDYPPDTVPWDSWTKYKTTYKKWDDVPKLSPGVYTNGIKFTANDHTLEPGVYYFPPGQTFTATGGSISGENVTLVFQPATGQNSGGFSFNTSVTLTAPSTGDFAGVVIASKGTMQNQGFNSASIQPKLDGAIYAPFSTVNFNGPMSNDTKCLVIVADSVNFAGGPILGQGCVPASMNVNLFQTTRLVE